MCLGQGCCVRISIKPTVVACLLYRHHVPPSCALVCDMAAASKLASDLLAGLGRRSNTYTTLVVRNIAILVCVCMCVYRPVEVGVSVAADARNWRCS